MKTIKLFLITIALSGLHHVGHGQTSPKLNVLTEINLQGATQVFFKPTGAVKIKYWELDRAKVEVLVDEPNFSHDQLTLLIPMGVFDISSYTVTNTAFIDAPGKDLLITINSNRANPEIRYLITLPRNISFAQTETPLIAESNSLHKLN